MKQPLDQFADRIIRCGEVEEFIRGLIEKGAELPPDESVRANGMHQAFYKCIDCAEFVGHAPTIEALKTLQTIHIIKPPVPVDPEGEALELLRRCASIEPGELLNLQGRIQEFLETI